MFIFHFIKMSELAEIMQVEESEKDAKAVADFEIKDNHAEGSEQHEYEERNRMRPEYRGKSHQQGDGQCDTEKESADA